MGNFMASLCLRKPGPETGRNGVIGKITVATGDNDVIQKNDVKDTGDNDVIRKNAVVTPAASNGTRIMKVEHLKTFARGDARRCTPCGPTQGSSGQTAPDIAHGPSVNAGSGTSLDGPDVSMQ